MKKGRGKSLDMSESKTPIPAWNPWKYATLGILIVLATALITGVVVANYVGNHNAATDLNPPPQAADAPPGQRLAAPTTAAPPPPPRANWAPGAPRSSAWGATRYASARPSKSDIERCNRYASEARNHTGQTLTDTLFGGALGAGLGAASGAIAGGGGGAGKGAGIGGLVGAAAGTLYGLNQANQEDKRSVAAYRACMRRHGYAD